MLALGSHSPRETAADGAAGLAEGSRVGCYHRADIRAALAVVSQGASHVHQARRGCCVHG